MKSEALKVVMKLQPAQYQLNIQNSVEEIKLMSKHTFTKKLKENGRKMNHSILLEQGEQGKENNIYHPKIQALRNCTSDVSLLVLYGAFFFDEFLCLNV